MDAINNIGTGAIPRKERTFKTTKKSTVSDTPPDNFSKSVSTDIPTKPTFKPPATKEEIGLMGSMNPALQAGVASGAQGSPIFKSLAGSLAKLLISTKQEIKLGQMLVEQVESSMPISKDPASNARVNNIGKKIAANSSRKDIPYTFKVIDDDTVNAFACPGGPIYVHKGLLDRFPDDNHLAFILGHEVGHIEHRDSIDKLGTNFVLQIIQMALGRTPGKLDDKLGAAIGLLYDNKLSRGAEYKADLAGAKHMEKLGINPRKGAEALRGLESAGQREPNVLEKILSTHPPTEKRAKKLEKYANKKGYS